MSITLDEIAADSHSIRIEDSAGHELDIQPDGSINVNADLSSAIADDQADSGNPIKMGGRAVSGALTPVSASNDRYDLLGDLFRRTWVNDSYNIGAKNTQANATTTNTQVLGTPLDGRREVIVQNTSNTDAYLSHLVGTLPADAIKIPKRASMSFKFGPDVPLFLQTASGTADCRLLEAA
jgi:hypothetical protein